MTPINHDAGMAGKESGGFAGGKVKDGDPLQAWHKPPLADMNCGSGTDTLVPGDHTYDALTCTADSTPSTSM